jgi:hypothetical protein
MPQNDPYAALATPVDPYAALAKPIVSAPPQPSSMLSQIGQGLENFGKGAAKGLSNTSQGVLNMIAPKGSFFNSDPAEPAPQNTAQKLGYGAEQMGEYFLPGVNGDALATKVAPVVGKVAGRILANTATTALLSKAQGGSATVGGTLGAAGGAAGEGARAIAPYLAETALGVRGTDRAFSASPGRAVLDQTTGLSPLKVANSARDAVSDLGAQQKAVVNASTAPVSLMPSRDAITGAMQSQADQNAMTGIDRIRPLADQLSVQGAPRAGLPAGVFTRRPSGTEIPGLVSPSEALDLRQGLSNFQPEKPWTGKSSSDPVTNAIKSSYGPLTEELHAAVPALAPIDQNLHNLLPVADRATAKDLNAPFLQRVAGRVGAHTGAGLAAVTGGTAGYLHGGPAGALLGGAAGLVIPELLSEPAVQMGFARAANKGFALPGISRGVAALTNSTSGTK